MESMFVQASTQDSDEHVKSSKETPFLTTHKVNGKPIEFKIILVPMLYTLEGNVWRQTLY